MCIRDSDNIIGLVFDLTFCPRMSFCHTCGLLFPSLAPVMGCCWGCRATSLQLFCSCFDATHRLDLKCQRFVCSTLVQAYCFRRGPGKLWVLTCNCHMHFQHMHACDFVPATVRKPYPAAFYITNHVNHNFRWQSEFRWEHALSYAGIDICNSIEPAIIFPTLFKILSLGGGTPKIHLFW